MPRCARTRRPPVGSSGSHRYLPRRSGTPMRWSVSRFAKSSPPADVPAHGARMQHLDVGDGAAGDPALQSAPYDLDLGQLGHGVSL